MSSIAGRLLPSLIAILTAASATAAPLLLRSGTIDPPAKSQAAVQAAAQAPHAKAYYIVQFQGPVRDDWKAAVQLVGAKLGGYVPDYAFIAKMTREQAARVLALDCVAWIERLASTHRFDGRLAAKKLPQCDVLMRLFPGESADELVALLRRYGGKVTDDSDPSGLLIRASLPPRAVEFVARAEGVEWIEEWLQPRPTNDVSQGIMGVPQLRQRVGLYGAGQIVAFADSGLDTGDINTLSADFTGRVYKTYGIRRPGVWSDLSGHGTHVLGVGCGSGLLSGSQPSGHDYTGSFAGVAPEAQVIIQSIGDNSDFVYPPLDLSTMFQPSYDDGARVHNDSWGSPSRGLYTVYSQQLDAYAWNHKDFVVVCSAGNDSVDANSDGVADLDYIYAPGTAKNCITVGATESLRTRAQPPDGWMISYGDPDWGFNVAPISNDHISNNASGMVAWSSRGPCDDGRFKPDICAPGTNIISARSHADGVRSRWWLIYDSNYVYWGGTSMSTPMVTGAAALVREYYANSWGIQPSAALVKATLLNGAHDVTPGQYSYPYQAEVPVRPNSVEGWGRMDLSASLDPPAPKVVEFVDDASGLSTGQSREYQYPVLYSSTPLAVTLVWTDPPASLASSKQLVNDLNLTVTDPNNIVRRGNGTVDSTNNVEGVDIAAPVVGTYRVTVSGQNVPQGPQPFALVISGALPGGYIAGNVRTASGNPIAGVTIAVTDGSTKTTATGADGAYTSHVVPGTYTLTPSKSGWTFDPPTRVVTVGETGVIDVDFTGSAAPAQVSGTITKTAGGMTNYVLESSHPYENNSDIVYTITGHPNATKIRVHFNEIAVQNGMDFVKVETIGGTVVNSYTGDVSDRWSDWVNYKTLKVRLTSNGDVSDFGFHIDGYETDVINLGGVSGVTVTAEPGGASAVSGPSGAYTISGLEPISYTITPSLPHYKFQPSEKPANLVPGSITSGVDFQAFPPGTVSGSVTTAGKSQQAQVVQSAHPYDINANETYPVVGPAGTTRIRVHFAPILNNPGIEMEPGFDFIYVTNAVGNVVDTFTGTYEDEWSSWVSGDRLNVVLESDDSTCLYGFYIDKYEVEGTQRGVQSVTVTVSPGGAAAVTNASGAYSVANVDTGLCDVVPSKPYWTFDPVLTQVNVVAGVTTSLVNFVGTLSAMPDISFVKSLPDGEEVLLTGKVVTAGTSEMGGCFYIEESNRKSGIKVTTAEPVARGSLVTVQGIVRTVACERYIEATDVSVTSTGATLPKPLGLSGRAMGGGPLNAHAPGMTGSHGANNIGLLARIWGRVRSVGSNSFYVDDGSRMGSILPSQAWVKVVCPSGVSLPDVGNYVVLTGICSGEADGGDCARVLRIRENDDIGIAQVSQ